MIIDNKRKYQGDYLKKLTSMKSIVIFKDYTFFHKNMRFMGSSSVSSCMFEVKVKATARAKARAKAKAKAKAKTMIF